MKKLILKSLLIGTIFLHYLLVFSMVLSPVVIALISPHTALTLLAVGLWSMVFWGKLTDVPCPVTEWECKLENRLGVTEHNKFVKHWILSGFINIYKNFKEILDK